MQPTPYIITTDFSQEEASGVAGRSTLRTPALDVELGNIQTTLGQVLTNLAIIQRDDTGLADLTVKLNTVSAEVLALMDSAGFTVHAPIGWLTATSYPARDMVKQGTGTYVSVAAHTSGVFATDLAAGKWVLLFDSSNYVASGISFTPTGTVSATNVQNAIAEVASEAMQKASNLSDVASAATSRANLGVPSISEVQGWSANQCAASGTADAIVGSFTPAITALANNLLLLVECGAANATPTPTFTPNNGVVAPKTIVRPDGTVLAIADIAGANYKALFCYDASLDKWILINPAPGAANVQTGMVIDFAGTSAPSGYLVCDGSNVSRTTYAGLFTAIGTTWGVGDGSTTFGLPDSRRRTAVGSGGTGTGTLGNAVGNTGGSETHALTTAEHAVHSHPNTATTTGTVNGTAFMAYPFVCCGTNVQQTGAAAGTVTMTNANAGSGTAHNNIQPSYVVAKIIKT